MSVKEPVNCLMERRVDKSPDSQIEELYDGTTDEEAEVSSESPCNGMNANIMEKEGLSIAKSALNGLCGKNSEGLCRKISSPEAEREPSGVYRRKEVGSFSEMKDKIFTKIKKEPSINSDGSHFSDVKVNDFQVRIKEERIDEDIPVHEGENSDKETEFGCLEGNTAFLCVICGENYQAHALLVMHMSCKHGVNIDSFTSDGSNTDQVRPGKAGDNTTTYTDEDPNMDVSLGDTTLRRMGSGKVYQCPFCEKVLSTQFNLNGHIRTHTGEKPYKCHLCDRAFSQACNLNGHIRTHTGEKPYKCNFCEMFFTQRNSLKAHTRTHTGEKPYKCSVCDKSFRQRSGLKDHERYHTGEKKFHCTLCDKIFPYRGSLSAHMRKHTGQRPFKCTLCEKDYALGSSLKDHMRTHSGERPFQCSVCEKSFKMAGNLASHMRTHTGERPYKCKLCNKGFTVTKSLKDHMRTHTGEKPFQCTICRKSFSLKSNQKKHMKLHEDKKPLQVTLFASPVKQTCESDSPVPEEVGDGLISLSHKIKEEIGEVMKLHEDQKPMQVPLFASPVKQSCKSDEPSTEEVGDRHIALLHNVKEEIGAVDDSLPTE